MYYIFMHKLGIKVVLELTSHLTEPNSLVKIMLKPKATAFCKWNLRIRWDRSRQFGSIRVKI